MEQHDRSNGSRMAISDGLHPRSQERRSTPFHINKILVVEDSQLLQKGYEMIFRRYKSHGCQVLHAFNGLEGLDRLSENRDCELIILDINMPEMSGHEFLRACKRHHAYKKIPVIIVTTEGADHDIMRGLEAGADAYLVKPFNVEDLHDLIGKIFASRRCGKQESEYASAV